MIGRGLINEASPSQSNYSCQSNNFKNLNKNAQNKPNGCLAGQQISNYSSSRVTLTTKPSSRKRDLAEAAALPTIISNTVARKNMI
jgi:hypothetical protein